MISRRSFLQLGAAGAGGLLSDTRASAQAPSASGKRTRFFRVDFVGMCGFVLPYAGGAAEVALMNAQYEPLLGLHPHFPTLKLSRSLGFLQMHPPPPDAVDSDYAYWRIDHATVEIVPRDASRGLTINDTAVSHCPESPSAWNSFRWIPDLSALTSSNNPLRSDWRKQRIVNGTNTSIVNGIVNLRYGEIESSALHDSLPP